MKTEGTNFTTTVIYLTFSMVSIMLMNTTLSKSIVDIFNLDRDKIKQEATCSSLKGIHLEYIDFGVKICRASCIKTTIIMNRQFYSIMGWTENHKDKEIVAIVKKMNNATSINDAPDYLKDLCTDRCGDEKHQEYYNHSMWKLMSNRGCDDE